MTRLAVPAIIAVLVVMGGLTAGLILAWDRTQSPTSLAETDLVAVPEHKNPARPGPKVSAPDPTHTLKPELEPPDTLVTVAKGTKAELEGGPDPDPTTIPGPQIGPSAEEAGSGQEGTVQGTVYTWQDGDKTRRAILQPRPEVRETVAATIGDSAISEGRTEDSVVKGRDESTEFSEEPELATDDQPIFRSESGGELMTLPGGILLVLDPQWDRDAVESFFSRNSIAMEQTSELDFLDNGFFVETEPGLPSLELANFLVGQDGVILSSPNWAREVEQR